MPHFSFFKYTDDTTSNMDQSWKDAHKGHRMRLILLEALDMDVDDYPYAYVHSCDDCCKYFGVDGTKVTLIPLYYKKIQSMLPKCVCGGTVIYDPIKGCAICKDCLDVKILPTDFLEGVIQ